MNESGVLRQNGEGDMAVSKAEEEVKDTKKGEGVYREDDNSYMGRRKGLSQKMKRDRDGVRRGRGGRRERCLMSRVSRETEVRRRRWHRRCERIGVSGSEDLRRLLHLELLVVGRWTSGRIRCRVRTGYSSARGLARARGTARFVRAGADVGIELG